MLLLYRYTVSLQEVSDCGSRLGIPDTVSTGREKCNVLKFVIREPNFYSRWLRYIILLGNSLGKFMNKPLHPSVMG